MKGWTTKTGVSVFDRIRDLKQYVGGFLVTFVEREGRMQGIDLEMVKKVCGGRAHREQGERVRQEKRQKVLR